jgi:hypothetical protein
LANGICRPLRSFGQVLPIIRYHHERWDGGGYPDGLRGEEIPGYSQNLQIVDVFDALCSQRPYKATILGECQVLDQINEEWLGKGGATAETNLRVHPDCSKASSSKNVLCNSRETSLSAAGFQSSLSNTSISLHCGIQPYQCCPRNDLCPIFSSLRSPESG